LCRKLCRKLCRDLEIASRASCRTTLRSPCAVTLRGIQQPCSLVLGLRAQASNARCAGSALM
jgi:hypothetical protein